MEDNKKLKMEIAGYCRISVDEEMDRENTSIENQKDMIQNYVKRTFPKCTLTFYEDRDRSGYTFEQRDGYQKLRKRIEARGDCGSPMFSMSRSDPAPAYTCGTYHKRGLKGCTSHHTRVDFLDKILKKYIRTVKENSTQILDELEKSISQESDSVRENETLITVLTHQAVGGYIGKIYQEVKGRPRYRIEQFLHRKD